MTITKFPIVHIVSTYLDYVPPTIHGVYTDLDEAKTKAVEAYERVRADEDYTTPDAAMVDSWRGAESLGYWIYRPA